MIRDYRYGYGNGTPGTGIIHNHGNSIKPYCVSSSQPLVSTVPEVKRLSITTFYRWKVLPGPATRRGQPLLYHGTATAKVCIYRLGVSQRHQIRVSLRLSAVHSRNPHVLYQSHSPGGLERQPRPRKRKRRSTRASTVRFVCATECEERSSSWCQRCSRVERAVSLTHGWMLLPRPLRRSPSEVVVICNLAGASEDSRRRPNPLLLLCRDGEQPGETPGEPAGERERCVVPLPSCRLLPDAAFVSGATAFG